MQFLLLFFFLFLNMCVHSASIFQYLHVGQSLDARIGEQGDTFCGAIILLEEDRK